jgi:hypothetical protein
MGNPISVDPVTFLRNSPLGIGDLIILMVMLFIIMIIIPVAILPP